MKYIYNIPLLAFIFTLTSVMNAQTNVSGIINTNTTWTQANSPYIVTGNILVQTGSTLTIDPGVVVKVNLGLYIRIDGKINCVGTTNNFIIFESNTLNPQNGNWTGINIRPTGGGLINSEQNYISGSQFKYTKIKHANNGLYIYNTGIYVDNCEFIDNNNGIELRNTNGVVINSSTFFDNNSGIYSEYETFLPNDVSNNIINTYIKNNVFNENGNGIDLNLNQRSFENLIIYKNRFTNNDIGIDFSGGGYGCKIISTDIDNNIFNNNSIGLQVGQIYGYGGNSGEPQGASPFKVVKNTFVNNPIYWNYGGGVSGVTSKIKNNIIYNPSSGVNSSNLDNGIYFTGGTQKNDTISNNLIYSLRESISLQDSYTDPSNKIFLNNTIIGNPKYSDQMISIFGEGHVFNHNNLKVFSNKFTFKNNSSSIINAENNFWSTSNENEIQAAIYDFNDNFELGLVDYTPYLNTPNILAPISPPINVVKTISGNDVVLTWNANLESDLSGYKLYFGNPTGYSYDNVIDLGNVTSYTIANGNLSNEYALTAYDNLANNIEDQVEGNESWFSIANALPELPSNITVEVAPRKSKLSWTLSSSNNVTGYKIFKGTSPNPTTLLTTVSNSTVSYTDTELTNGTTYYYSIKSIDSNGLESVSSPDLSATPTNTWYVATTGAIDGFGSSNSPMNAIQTAIDASEDLDLVIVSPGTYYENLTIYEKVITVSTPNPNSSSSNTIIDGGANGFPVVLIEGNSANLNNLNAELKFSGFTIQNGLSPTYEIAGGLVVKGIGHPNLQIKLEHLIIENNIATNAPGGSYFYYTNKLLLNDITYRNNNGVSTLGAFNANFEMDKCQFYNNTSTTTLFDFWHNSSTNSYSIIKNSLIKNNTGNGTFNVMDGLIFNSTIVTSGLNNSFRGKSAIINSIIGQNQFISSTEGLLNISNSLIQDGQNSVTVSIPTFLTYQNNLSGDIQFVNSSQENFRLSDYSKAIGHGVNSINLYSINYDLNSGNSNDLDNNIRPFPAGSNIDLGAYENELATTLHNSTIYVATDGNNTGSVGLETAPFATIQAAINYAIDGDQILVKPGTYTGTFSVTKSISISSTDGYQQTNLVVLGMHQSIFDINGGDFSNLINVNITGFKFSTNTPNIIQTGISVSVGAFAKVEKCWFENISKSFGTYYGFYDVINSVFKNVGDVAFHDAGYSNNDRLSRIINCTIINANKITVAQSQYYHKIYNTIITRENQSLEPYFTSGVFPYLEKVLIDSNPNTQSGSVFTTISSINDIYFNDILNNDYSLKNYSPAIGYGGALSEVLDDIDGNPRPGPILSFPDVGAYENPLATPSNAPPKMDAINDISIDEDAPQQTIMLTGINDGDLFSNQNLSLSFTNDQTDLFSEFTLNYVPNSSTASITFTPAPDAHGLANITLNLQDSGSETNGGINNSSFTFSITINPINDAPVANDDIVTIDEDNSIIINVIQNDTDVDGNINPETLLIMTPPAHGSVTVNNLTGEVTYTPNENYFGQDEFVYEVCDDGFPLPSLCDQATVFITINPINDAPVANDVFVSSDEDTPIVINVTQNNTDVDGNIDPETLQILTPPEHGSVTVNNLTGEVTYTPNENYFGQDEFVYEICDDGFPLPSLCDQATVFVTINAINDAPVANDDEINLDEDSPIVINVIQNDTDVDGNIDPETLQILTPPEHGSVTVNNLTGEVTYTPNENYFGQDTFTYQVCDNGFPLPALCDQANVNITINPINDAPVANDDEINLDEGSSANILTNGNNSVLDNDFDVDGDVITAILVQGPSHGSLILNEDGTFLYTHDNSETILDSFTYKANDGILDSNIATVTITINPVNNNFPSDINLSQNTIEENTTGVLIGSFETIDLDLPFDSHTYQLVNGEGDSDNSSFEIINNELYNIMPFDYETVQLLSIRVRSTDDNNQFFEKSFMLNVINVNDISISFNVTDAYCEGELGDGSIQITSINETLGVLSFNWSASNGGIVPEGQGNNQDLINLTPGTYHLTLQDEYFEFTETFEVNLIPAYNELQICYISSDEVETQKNRIFLNKTGAYNTSEYEILRETNVSNIYESIGFLNPEQESYLDENSNNLMTEYKYKVRAIDNCGNSSNLSTFHKTILLQSSVAVNNSVNLNWTIYLGVEYSSYQIYRKVDNGSFELLATVSSSTQSYNDVTANVTTSTYEYYISISAPDCSDSQSQDKMSFSSAEIKSNILNTSNLNVLTHTADLGVSIYPNPSSNEINIAINDAIPFLKAEIIDLSGKLVLSSKEKSISIKDLPSSSYIIKIYTQQGNASKVFIKK
ncbi:tandem-95 repeat protein [Psychroflexus maritimus]|uniref:Tandem-95 repeat protein n=1 Tax=Psychroflexus maritimus TaxID=2714865 RepID=A0A967ADT9_9FLAO|nr:Ig-like domain-containing protein [Psychroflexus maritimus]NGZ90221.1 tandem-95 repeat protein [Psychroflexus maritimus]